MWIKSSINSWNFVFSVFQHAILFHNLFLTFMFILRFYCSHLSLHLVLKYICSLEQLSIRCTWNFQIVAQSFKSTIWWENLWADTYEVKQISLKYNFWISSIDVMHLYIDKFAIIMFTVIFFHIVTYVLIVIHIVASYSFRLFNI